MNPAGQTPVLVETNKGDVLIDSNAICEYFEETIDKAPMIPGTAINRAEVRRLVAWFDDRLYADVVAPLLEERSRKRLVPREPPETRVPREAIKVAHPHLAYITQLLE